MARQCTAARPPSGGVATRGPWRPEGTSPRLGVLLAAALLLGGTPWLANGKENVPAAVATEAAQEKAAGAAASPPAREAATKDADGERLPEMVVTANRTPTPAQSVPAAVTVIPDERLHRPGAANIKDGLTAVPGIKLSTRQDQDVATTGLELRGLGTNATSGTNALVLLDGIPQRRLSFGGPYLGVMPYEAVTRMELVQGPLSSLYGRGALAGALQLFTDPGSREFHTHLATTFEGGTDTLRESLRLSGPLAPLPEATFSIAGSRSSMNGWQPGTEGRQEDHYLHLELPLSEDDTLTIIAGYFSADRDMAAPVLIDKDGDRLDAIDRDTNLSVPGHNHLTLDEFRLGTIWTHNLTDSLQSKLTLAYWNADTDWLVGRPTDRPATGTIINRPSDERLWQENSLFSELQLQQQYDVTEGVSGVLSAGGSVERWFWNSRMQSIWSPGSNASRGILLDLTTMDEPDRSTWIYGPWTERDTEEVDSGLFLRNTLNLYDRVDADAGVRFDSYRRTQENLTNGNRAVVTGSAVDPSLGLAYHLVKGGPTALTAYANWGLGFSPVYRAVGSTEIVDVDPETSESCEVGLKGSLYDGRIEGTLSVFRLDRNDVVGTLPSANTQANIGDWRTQGVELGLKTRPTEGLTLYGTTTVRLPEIERDAANPQTAGNDIPGVSRQMACLGAEYKHSSGAFAGIENRYTTRSYADAANTIHLPAYDLVDAYVGYAWRNYSVSFFVRNLLDTEYYADIFNGVVNGSAFEGTPRTLGVTLEAQF